MHLLPHICNFSGNLIFSVTNLAKATSNLRKNSIKDLIAKMADLKRQLKQSQVNIEGKLIIDNGPEG